MTGVQTCALPIYIAESHVVADEGKDLGAVVVGETQAGEDALGYANTGLDVAVETNTAAGDCGVGRLVSGGLADVVEQRAPGEGW